MNTYPQGHAFTASVAFGPLPFGGFVAAYVDVFAREYFKYFVEKFLNEFRKAIVWDDALEGDGPSESAVIMSWRGTEPSSVSLPVILSPFAREYFKYFVEKFLNEFKRSFAAGTEIRTTFVGVCA